MYFVFLSDGRAPKRHGARGNLPPYLTLSRGLLMNLSKFVRYSKSFSFLLLDYVVV